MNHSLYLNKMKILLLGVSFSFSYKSSSLVGRSVKSKFTNETFFLSQVRVKFRKDYKITLINVSLKRWLLFFGRLLLKLRFSLYFRRLICRVRQVILSFLLTGFLNYLFLRIKKEFLSFLFVLFSQNVFIMIHVFALTILPKWNKNYW